jgi:hypothetical protein
MRGRHSLLAASWVLAGLLLAAPAGARVVDLDVIPAFSDVAIAPTSGIYFDRPPEQGGTVFVPFTTQTIGGVGGPTNGLRAPISGRIRVDFRPDEQTLRVIGFSTLFAPVASGQWLPGVPTNAVQPAPAQAAVALGSEGAFASGRAALRRLAISISTPPYALAPAGAGRWRWPADPSADPVELLVADGRVDFAVSVVPTLTSAFVREGGKQALPLSGARRVRVTESDGDRLELRVPLDVSIEQALPGEAGGALPLRVRLDLEGELLARNFIPEPGAAGAALAAIAALALLASRRRAFSGRELLLVASYVLLIGAACPAPPPNTCDNDDHCPNPQKCVKNACTDDGSCENPADCPGGELCRAGTCKPPAGPAEPCEGDGDCASGACTNDQCEGNGSGETLSSPVSGPDVISDTRTFGLPPGNRIAVAGANGLAIIDPLTGTIPTIGNATLSFLNGFIYRNLLGALVIEHPSGTGADAIFAYRNDTGASVQSYVPAIQDFGATGLLFGTYRDAVHLGDDPAQSEALLTATSLVQRFTWTDFGGGLLSPGTETALASFTGAGVPVSAFAFPDLTRILVVTMGTPGKLAIGNPETPFTAVTVIGDVGDHPRRIRCLGGACAISNFGSGSLTIATWDGATNVAITDSQDVGDGPIGIDLRTLPGGNLAVASTGFHDSTYSLTVVSPAGAVLASETRPAPEGCVQPGHALWLGDGQNHLVLSCFGSDALAVFVPEIP